MTDIDIDGGLGNALKGLLTSFMLDDFDGSIKTQNDAISKRASSIADETDDDAPMGFPLLPDIEEMNLLQYLNKHKVLTFEEQLHLAADNLSERGQRKINASTRKRMIKLWKGNFEGKTRELEILLTQMLLHPSTRVELVGGLQEQVNWLKDPVVKMVRAAHNWLGFEGSIETVKGFTDQYQTDIRYWPLEIWESIPVDEFGREDADGARIANAFEGFFIKLLSKAKHWEKLNAKQRGGILLGIYAASSLMSTRTVLVPFSAVIPNLNEYLNFSPVSHVGLCDNFGEPTPLFNFARNLAESIKSDTGRSHGELIYSVISSTISTVGSDMSRLDGMKTSLRAYFASRLARRMSQIGLNFDDTIKTFRAEGSPYALTAEGDDFITKVQKSIQLWCINLQVELAFDGNRIVDLTDIEAARYDYWVAQFMGVMAIEEYCEPFDQHLTEKGVNIEVIQQRAQEAVLKMDTDTLAVVTQQMAEAKSAAEGILISLYKPLLITSDQLAKQPCDTVTTIEANHNGDDDHFIDDMAQTIEGLEGELDAEKQRASQLGKALALANDEITQLQAAAEADATSNSDAFVALIRSSTPLAVIEAFKSLAGNHVVVLDSALASAKKSAFKNTAKLMEALSILSDEYYNQIVVEGKPDAVAKNTLGFAYRAGESDQTMAVQKLRAQREFKYEGETVTCTQHLTLGTKRGNQTSIQVHFKIIDKKLVIARVGTHLDVASS